MLGNGLPCGLIVVGVGGVGVADERRRLVVGTIRIGGHGAAVGTVGCTAVLVKLPQDGLCRVFMLDDAVAE